MRNEYPLVFSYKEDINSLIDSAYLSFIERNDARFYIILRDICEHAKCYPPAAVPSTLVDFEPFTKQIMRGNRKRIRWMKRAHWVADVLYYRYMATGALADLDKSIDIVEQENLQTSWGIPNHIRLGVYLNERFTICHNIVDIDRSIGSLSIALDSMRPNEKLRSVVINLVVCSISNRLGVDGPRSRDITMMKKLDSERLSPTIEGATILEVEAGLAWVEYLMPGYAADRSRPFGYIDRTVTFIRQAIRYLPVKDSKRVSYLNRICVPFGGILDVFHFNTCIDIQYDMLEMTKDSPDLQGPIHAQLGIYFHRRYHFFKKDKEDLEEAIRRYNEALVLGLSDDDYRRDILLKLSELYIYESSGNSNTGSLMKAYEILSDRFVHTGRNIHHLLVHGLVRLRAHPRFRREAVIRELPALIDFALDEYRKKIRCAPYGSRSRMLIKLELSALLCVPAVISRKTQLEVIEIGEECFSHIPHHITERFGLRMCARLACLMMTCHKNSGEPLDASIAMEILERLDAGARNLESTICCRLQCVLDATIVLGEIPGMFRRWDMSFMYIQEAIKILSEASPVYYKRNQRHLEQMKLSQYSLGSSAVTMGLQAGNTAYCCLAALEQSRGIVLGFIIDCRSTGNLQGLREVNPDLYNKLNELHSRLDSQAEAMEDISLAGNLGSWQSGMALEVDKRQKMNDADDLARTIQDIRRQPGFEQYQLPPSYEMLIKMAENGPVVVEACTKIRSDAIIITSSGIKSIPLPKLDFIAAKRQIKQLNTKIIPGAYTSYRSRSQKMENFLLWLWDVAVKDVIEELKKQGIVSENSDASTLPRIWWIGVDFLNFAPFHAAGNHSPGSTENTLHYAMSSYIPTLKALTFAREKPLNILERDSKLLLVAMPETPGQSPLISVEDEIGEIASLVPEGIRTEVLVAPSAKETLESLPLASIAHFACHGFSDPREPFKSRLLLQLDVRGTPTVDNLTAEAISSINIQQAQIAYLSACSTARTIEESANDPIHIASAFQLAGFSHVLANMWPVDDGACLKVSTEFYRNLFDGSPSGDASGHRKVGAAFHHAVKKLRDENRRLPLLWSPFIHTGA